MKVVNENQALCWYFIKPRTKQVHTVCTISSFPHISAHVLSSVTWLEPLPPIIKKEVREPAAAAKSGTCSDMYRFYL